MGWGARCQTGTIKMKANTMPSSDSHSFTASYDTATKIISAVFCAILVSAVAVTHNAFVGILCAAVFALSYAYSPRAYTISRQSVIVKRAIGKVRIPLDGIVEARVATEDDFRGCIRLFGNGGLFGYYGLFRTSKLGKCWWYVTNRSNAVVIITGAKTTVLSPDDTDGFLAAIRASSPIGIVA
jgi:hypothetical protein